MLMIVIFLPIGSTGADDGKDSVKIGLVTKPAKVLFDVQNIKPGDVIQRKLSIENHENVNFNYKMQATFIDGSKKLYNQLLLQVTDGNNIIFDGALSDFTGLDKRELAFSNSDQFTFNVEFPYESGNEFQGLATQFQFIISAGLLPGSEANGSTLSTKDTSGLGESLPQTGKFISFIAYFAGGILLFTLGMLMFLAKRGKLSSHLFGRGKI